MPSIKVPLQQPITVATTEREIDPVASLDLNKRPNADYGTVRGRYFDVVNGQRTSMAVYEIKLDAQAAQTILAELIRLAKAQGVGGLDNTSIVNITP